MQALMGSAAAPAAVEDGMRQVASPLPPALLGESGQRIAGEPLNASAEQQARSQG